MRSPAYTYRTEARSEGLAADKVGGGAVCGHGLRGDGQNGSFCFRCD